MFLQHDLARFLEERIIRPGNDGAVRLDEDSELLTSGLIPSLMLLELAEWIEEHTASPIDLLLLRRSRRSSGIF